MNYSRYYGQEQISTGAGDCRDSQRPSYRTISAGITLVELLVVLAIVGVILALAVINGRTAAIQRSEQAAVRSLQQSIWQGATAASARGRETELVIEGQRVTVRQIDTGEVVKVYELPNDVTTNLPRMVFTPPGKVSDETFDDLPEDLHVATPDRTYSLTVSVIGEVVAEVQE